MATLELGSRVLTSLNGALGLRPNKLEIVEYHYATLTVSVKRGPSQTLPADIWGGTEAGSQLLGRRPLLWRWSK
jgi:hypothetical protein